MSLFRPPPARAAGVPISAAAFSGAQADARVAALRRALSEALDDWWRASLLPATPVLRDGLLALEAGHTFDEATTALLLRGALAQHRGMLTALSHQGDPERTGDILCDALLAPEAPLTPAELSSLRSQDAESEAWMPALRTALLNESNSPDVLRREAALATLGQLAGDPYAAYAPGEFGDAAWFAGTGEPDPAPWLRTTWVRGLLILVPLVALVAGVLWWQQRGRNEGLVRVPPGVYTVSDPLTPGSEQQVTLPAFAIERTEVTNGAFRECASRGACAWPISNDSATRAKYLIDPGFGQYPVVNVDAANARRYCAFVGRRLPTAAEWEVAAGYAPGTQRRYPYPWGDQFQLQRANSAAGESDDTQTVGSYRPNGDSPLGVSDMAGNVAEWTATSDGEGRFVVKGGSFADEAAALAVTSQQLVEGERAAPWLGFRCAIDVADVN